jgi:transposase
VTFGDNPARIRSEPAFAMLCGVAPLPASSGMTQRHRLNRGGDRQANRALHMIVISRLRVDERTKAYAAKKTAQGHSKLEIIRCLKRLLAREVYYLLQPATAQHTAPPDLTAGRFLHPQPTRRRAGTGNLPPNHGLVTQA